MKKLVCLVLALLLCMGSALADVVIPELPGGLDKYSVLRMDDYTAYSSVSKVRTCSVEELDAFVRQLEEMGFRNEGSDRRMEFVYTGKGASGLKGMKGAHTQNMHVLIAKSGLLSLKIHLAHGITIADAESSATETDSQDDLKRFAVVVEIDGKSDLYYFETDETYLLDVLLADGFIKGEDASWGFNVTTVAGVKADYSRKGEYWSILEFNKESGQFEPMMDSLNGKKVEDGVGYTFVLRN